MGRSAAIDCACASQKTDLDDLLMALDKILKLLVTNGIITRKQISPPNTPFQFGYGSTDLSKALGTKNAQKKLRKK